LTGTGAVVDWKPVDVREQRSANSPTVVHGAVEPASYDRVVLPVPADRSLARRWLLTALYALVPGGVLVLAGANAEGAKSVMADAVKIFGAPMAEHYRQKHRIARFARPVEERELPSWAGAHGIAPGTWQRFDVAIDGESVTLETQPGVFAGDRVDAGTRFLLEHLDIVPGSRVLDVGCGAGVIGIVVSRRGAREVDLIDANLLAVEAASRNLGRLGVPGRAIASDVFSGVAGEQYDLVVSNPPFHRGKQVDYSVADRLISEAPGHMLPGGRFLIVANAFLAYGKHLDRVFQFAETVAATRQYHVLMAAEPRPQIASGP